MSRDLTLKTMTSSLLFGAALIAIVAMMSGASSNVQAQTSPQTCGLQTLHGLYVFATHGWNVTNGAAVPKAIVEGIHFNGDGTLVSPFATVSINGAIIHSNAGVGTYTVNSDCTGTLTFTPGTKLRHIRRPARRQAAVDDPDRSRRTRVTANGTRVRRDSRKGVALVLPIARAEELVDRAGA
jgi:hypothetical protein